LLLQAGVAVLLVVVGELEDIAHLLAHLVAAHRQNHKLLLRYQQITP
jgi:hypothetical protein